MSSSTLKKFLKWSLVVVPIGALAYINRHFYFGHIYKVHKFGEEDLSDFSKNYIKKNDLISPYTFQNRLKKYDQDHFFEKSILNQMNGLNIYNLYLERNYYQIITDEIEVSPEEKQQQHTKAKLHCMFTANSRVQGHLGIVHGGFISTLFDNLAGSLAFFVGDFTPAVTSYLNISYKKPLKIGKEYLTVLEVEKIEGKSIFIKGKIFDEENTVYTTFDSLFLKKSHMDNFTAKEIDKKIQIEKQIHDEEHNLQNNTNQNQMTKNN